jgi:hypothetical protein
MTLPILYAPRPKTLSDAVSRGATKRNARRRQRLSRGSGRNCNSNGGLRRSVFSLRFALAGILPVPPINLEGPQKGCGGLR